MCGRFTLNTTDDALIDVFDLAEVPEELVASRFNIAPTDPVPIVRASADGSRALTAARWGLLPGFAPDVASKSKRPLINARAETVATRGIFKHAFRRRRCLVPSDGWYEWKKAPDGRQPFRFVRHDRRPFGMAGLWEQLTTQDGEVIESCTVITVAPNTLAGQYHNRMPLVLDPAHFALWLDPAVTDPTRLERLLATPNEHWLYVYPVSRRVNSVRNQGPDLIDAVALQDSLF